MLNTLKVRKNQGYQAIPDIRAAKVRSPFRGLPLVNGETCGSCRDCLDICPAQAISLKPLSLDMGRCVFCGDCQRLCPKGNISFTTYHKIATSDRTRLLVNQHTTANSYYENAVQAAGSIRSIFGRSFKLRQVSAAGCNGCELELNACSNVNFDMGRFGIEIVASPRHADGLIITGPVSENMARALEDAYQATPEPKVIILAGSCAISGGVFHDSPCLQREFIEKNKIDLFIPGCPVHPLTVVNGILDFLGR